MLERWMRGRVFQLHVVVVVVVVVSFFLEGGGGGYHVWQVFNWVFDNC